jgi:hypothetical protein
VYHFGVYEKIKETVFFGVHVVSSGGIPCNTRITEGCRRKQRGVGRGQRVKIRGQRSEGRGGRVEGIDRSEEKDERNPRE